MQSCHPLAGVARWVNERGLALDIRLLGAADPEPRTAEWVRLDRLPERVPALLADLTVRTCAGHRTSAAAILASDAARQVAGFAAVAAYLVGRVPDLAAVRLWVRVAESGRPAALALRQGDVAMLAGDPMARRPGAVPLPDDDALDGWLAAAAVRTLEPVFQAIRAESRFGLRPQWSMLADALFRALPAAADEVGADQSAAWQRAEQGAASARSRSASRAARPAAPNASSWSAAGAASGIATRSRARAARSSPTSSASAGCSPGTHRRGAGKPLRDRTAVEELPRSAPVSPVSGTPRGGRCARGLLARPVAGGRADAGGVARPRSPVVG
ncbi:hypothetical protein [Marinitenerispora sediminis]|uniref:hypothetical protein n=1 Tax=Marinitenerispora sediminis TaxID=1931232 RepID=UPI0021613CBF|nr:hypothetical protein [Marinitenerispora sediminis]